MKTIAWGAAILLALTACGNAGQTASDPPVRIGGGRIYGNVQNGREYVERWCTTCHMMGATGSDSAPALALLKKNPDKTAAYIRGFLLAPHKPMPPLPLTTQEIEDIISYLLGPS